MSFVSSARACQPLWIDVSFAGRIASGFMATLRRYKSRWQLQAEFDGLPQHILRDIGLSQSDVTLLRQKPM